MQKRSRLALAFALIVILSLFIGILQVSNSHVQSGQNLSEIYSETYLLKSHNVTVLALAYANSPGDCFYAFSSELAQREGVPLYITN